MGELERIGESADFGYLLLELLERHGWTVHVRAAFAGDGIMIVGSHPALEFDITAGGARVADAAVPFFTECARWRHVTAIREEVAA